MAKIFGKFSKGCRRDKDVPQPHTPDETTCRVSVLESQGSFSSPSCLNVPKLPSILGWRVPPSHFPLIKREHGTKQNKTNLKIGGGK